MFFPPEQHMDLYILMVGIVFTLIGVVGYFEYKNLKNSGLGQGVGAMFFVLFTPVGVFALVAVAIVWLVWWFF